ncbi:hypothetical protein LJC71_09290 [Desulfosarcina sp. OttesenSCG-928-A07]|nr:hypothetical protein [Desulfosarcina sp. OttesenSCG-928-G17]MDL2329917.1 hypothetical protein [Desulfosarcina sp. OttesenSCG-928-A07]
MVLSDDEWSRRILCSDGACIGVIGPDGQCKECGKAYTGDLPLPVSDGPTDEDDTAAQSGDGDEAWDDFFSETDPEDGEDPVPDPEWKNRILCPDGNCIGVIGPDGRCGECGKSVSESGDDNLTASASGEDAAGTESHDHADSTPA